MISAYRPYSIPYGGGVPVVAGVADRVQMFNKILDTILLQADPHIDPLVRRSRTERPPAPWSAFHPLVLDFEVVPTFVWLLAQRGPNEERQEENIFQHLWVLFAVAV